MLSHLSKQQIEQLMTRYYAGEKTTDLIKEYDIKTTPGALYTHFPPKVAKNKCVYCDLHLETKWPSKSGSYKPEPSCPKCGHSEVKACNCKNCREKKEILNMQNNQSKREKIEQVYAINYENLLDSDQLPLLEQVYLAALLRVGVSEDLSTILPVEAYINQLAPTRELSDEIVMSLANKKIINVHPSSPLSGFKDGVENYPNIYFIHHVCYYVNVDAPVEFLMNPLRSTFQQDPDFCYRLWRLVALEESKQYLLYRMQKVNFPFKIGEKTIAVLEDLLNHFSVGQIQSLIYRAVGNATRYYQENRISKQQAANTVVSSLQKMGEKALASNWDLNSFKRNYDLPQTSISQVVFDRILEIGNKGFDICPSKDIFV